MEIEEEAALAGQHNPSNFTNEDEIKSPLASRRTIKRLAISTLICLFIFLSGQYFNTYTIREITDKANLESLSVDPLRIIKHIENIIDIGNSDEAYEPTRAKTREYIRDTLTQGGFPPDNVIWHTFEWKEKKATGRNITTTTWSGINIVVWTNSTPIAIKDQKIRIMGAHYDTKHWGLNKTSGAHDNLAGTGLLMELAIKINRLQQQRLKEDKNYQEIPYLFVFFDHEESGALGSKTFVEHHRIARYMSDISYFIDIDSIGYRGASPIIQTYPYEDKGKTLFTPRGLASALLQAAFFATEEGMTVGHPSLINSIVYQALRYHLISIPFLSDDGPFMWSGIQSALFTDLEMFFEGNPDYHQITDQVTNLSVEVLQTEANILAYFILATEDPNLALHHATSKNTIYGGLFWKLISWITKSISNSLFAGSDPYIALGPFSFGFLELFAMSAWMLYSVYLISIPPYRKMTMILNRYHFKGFMQHINHRLLFFHLIVLLFVLCFDTVYATLMILCAFPSLITISINRVNIVTSFISTLLGVNILLMDFYSMIGFGRRGPRPREMKLVILLTIYCLHSFFTLIYGWDYYIKEKLRKKLR